MKKLFTGLLIGLFISTCMVVHADTYTYVSNGTTFYYSGYVYFDYTYVGNVDYDEDGPYSSDYLVPSSITSNLSITSGAIKYSGNVVIPEGLPVAGKVFWNYDNRTSVSSGWTSTSNSASIGGAWTSKAISDNQSTTKRVYFATSGSITFTVVSNGENNYDYLTIGEIDQACTRTSYKYSLKGLSGKTQTYTYSPNDGQIHYIEFCYSKDGSQSSSTDNCTVYVSNIEKLDAPVKYIRGGAFSNCTGLTSLTIPNTVEDIGDEWNNRYQPPTEVFNGCTGLTSVTIADAKDPNSSERLTFWTRQDAVFADCPLQNLYIGRNVRFFQTTSYVEDEDDSDYDYTTGKIGKAFNKNISNLTFGNFVPLYLSFDIANSITNVRIENLSSWLAGSHSITSYWYGWTNSADNNSLSHAQNLYINGSLTTDLTIPAGTQTIGKSSFYGAKMLQSVTLPSGLTAISSDAFTGCTNLQTVINNSDLGIIAGNPNYGNVAYYATSVVGSNYMTDGDWMFLNTASGAHIIKYNGVGSNVAVPSMVNGNIPVTQIDEYTFRNCSTLIEIAIPESITKIGSNAFSGCTNLQKFTIEDSNTNLAFVGSLGVSKKIKELYLGRSVLGGAFPSIDSLTIGENVTSVDYISGSTNKLAIYTPSDLSKIRLPSSIDELTLGENVTTIPSYKFSNIYLKKVVIEGTPTFGSNAFSYSRANVYYPDIESWNATTFPNEAANPLKDSLFIDGQLVTELIVSDKLAYINQYAFKNCKSLKTITIASDAESVPSNAFTGCTNVDSVYYNSNKTEIQNAFSPLTNLRNICFGSEASGEVMAVYSGKSHLETVEFENSPISFVANAFQNCSSLQTVRISNLASWATADFANASANPLSIAHTLVLNNDTVKELTIGEGINQVGNYAFMNCQSIKNLTIGTDIESIGTNGLTGMALDELVIATNNSLTSSQLDGTTTTFTVGENVTELPIYSIRDIHTLRFNAARCTTTNGFFANHSTLKDIYVGDQVQMLPDNIFEGTNLESVVLGNSLKLIGTNAFNNCSSIRTINVRSITPPNCLSHFPVQVYMDAELVVPGEALNTYRNAPIWSTFFNITTHDEIVEPDVMAMERPNVVLDINDKTQLVVYLGTTIIPGNSLTWTSSNEAVATVNTNGQVTAIAAGRATIMATNANDESVSCEVNVKESQFANLDDYLMISNVETSRFASFNIPVYMQNQAEISAFQCDIYMPDGVNIKKNSKGKYAFTFGTRTDLMCHIISSAQLPDGAVRIVVYSTNNYAFSGNDGLLFNIPVEMGGQTGTFPYSIKNIVFSTTSNTAIYPIDVTSNITIRTATEGDANGDEIVNVIDVTTTVDYILGGSPESFVLDAADLDHNSVINVNDVTSIVDLILHPVSNAPARCKIARRSSAEPVNNFYIADADVTVGETTMIPVIMNNDSPIFGYQCDILMPEGMTLATNDRGQFMFTHGDRSDDHVLASSLLESGVYRLISYSPTNTLYSGNTGILFYIPVVAESNLAAGSYQITLTNIVLSEEGNHQIDLDEISALLTPNVKLQDAITWNIDLSDYAYEDECVLTASATSGLAVKFSLSILEGNTTEGEESAEISETTKRGVTTYKLIVYEDCLIEVHAYTEGDEYYSAISLSKKFHFEDGICHELVPEATEYRRPTNSGNYGTICLPKAVAQEDLEDCGGVFFNIVYAVTNTNMDVTGILMEEETGGLDAGKAYIFRATADELVLPYTGEAVAEPVAANGLVGNLSETPMDVPQGMYVLSNNQIRKLAGGTATAGQNRAYIDLTHVEKRNDTPAAAPNRVVLNVEGSNVATDLENIKSEDIQKVIRDGQVLILRDGKTYNVLGNTL